MLKVDTIDRLNYCIRLFGTDEEVMWDSLAYASEFYTFWLYENDKYAVLLAAPIEECFITEKCWVGKASTWLVKMK